MAESFAEQLQDLWEGKTVQQREVTNYSLSGMRCTSMQFSVLGGHQDDWSLVLLSLVDITARKKAEGLSGVPGQARCADPASQPRVLCRELNRLTRKGRGHLR